MAGLYRYDVPGDIKPKRIVEGKRGCHAAYGSVGSCLFDRLSAWRDLQAPFARSGLEEDARPTKVKKVKGALSRHCRTINQRRATFVASDEGTRVVLLARRNGITVPVLLSSGHTPGGAHTRTRGGMGTARGNVFLTDCAVLLAKIRTRTRPRQSSFKVLPAIYHWPH